MLFVGEVTLSLTDLNTCVKIENSPSPSIGNFDLLFGKLYLLPFVFGLLNLLLQGQIIISTQVQALVQISFLLYTVCDLSRHVEFLVLGILVGEVTPTILHNKEASFRERLQSVCDSEIKFVNNGLQSADVYSGFQGLLSLLK